MACCQVHCTAASKVRVPMQSRIRRVAGVQTAPGCTLLLIILISQEARHSTRIHLDTGNLDVLAYQHLDQHSTDNSKWLIRLQVR